MRGIPTGSGAVLRYRTLFRTVKKVFGVTLVGSLAVIRIVFEPEPVTVTDPEIVEVKT